MVLASAILASCITMATVCIGNKMMLSSAAARTGCVRKSALLLQGRRFLSFYTPTLTERRVGEAGTGGRNSEASLKVCVFGASGFLGEHLCSELGANGFMTYIGNRGDDLEMRHLKVNFELGRSRFVFYSPKDVDSIKEVIADADVVVNLIGKYHETGRPVPSSSFPYIKYQPNWTLYDTNVTLARTLAEVCKDMQVDHLVHVSSASASPTAKSEWSRTKYEGELAVKEAFPWVTIIRPTQLFGRMDRLLNWFARMQTYYRMVPLVDGGKALTQPVWVGDVAKTILRVCDDPAKFEGREIDCFGPADYTYEELATFVNSITDRNVATFDLPANYYKSLANILQWQRNPLMTPDLVDLWSENFLPRMDPEEYAKQTDESTKILTMKDLGINALPIEKEAFGYLHAFRFGGHFFRTPGYHDA